MLHLTPSTITTLRALLDEADDDIDLLAIILIFCPMDDTFIFKLLIWIQFKRLIFLSKANTRLKASSTFLKGAAEMFFTAAVEVWY